MDPHNSLSLLQFERSLLVSQLLSDGLTDDKLIQLGRIEIMIIILEREELEENNPDA